MSKCLMDKIPKKYLKFVDEFFKDDSGFRLRGGKCARQVLGKVKEKSE